MRVEEGVAVSSSDAKASPAGDGSSPDGIPALAVGQGIGCLVVPAGDDPLELRIEVAVVHGLSSWRCGGTS